MGILSNIKKIFSNEEKTAPTPAPAPKPKDPTTFYIDTLEFERTQKDRYLRTDAYSPIEDRMNFEGLDYYPPNLDYRYTLSLNPVEKEEEITFQTSTGDEQIYFKVGTIDFEVDGEPAQLAVYKSADYDDLFLPFRDATSGSETYGAGRYLEPQELGSGDLLVDFNLAYNPFCAYSESYSCPMPPFENHLKVAIRAGEKAYTK